VIRRIEWYHGVVLSRLVRGVRFPIRISTHPRCRSAYEVNDSAALYVKYSTSRMGPWLFVFKRAHHAEIAELSRIREAVFLVLVCGAEGIVCLASRDYERALAAGEESDGWIRAVRGHRTKFTVTGSGCLKAQVSDDEFPTKVYAALGPSEVGMASPP
jgi:hypothetical protein